MDFRQKNFLDHFFVVTGQLFHKKHYFLGTRYLVMTDIAVPISHVIKSCCSLRRKKKTFKLWFLDASQLPLTQICKCPHLHHPPFTSITTTKKCLPFSSPSPSLSRSRPSPPQTSVYHSLPGLCFQAHLSFPVGQQRLLPLQKKKTAAVSALAAAGTQAEIIDNDLFGLVNGKKKKLRKKEKEIVRKEKKLGEKQDRDKKKRKKKNKMEKKKKKKEKKITRRRRRRRGRRRRKRRRRRRR